MTSLDPADQPGTPFDAYIVAIDIVGFSRNSNHDINLFKDRAALFRAVKETQLFKACRPFGQFLGDELRIAFPTTGIFDFDQFFREVFGYLDDGKPESPTIKAGLARGQATILDLHGCKYLSGPSVVDVQRALALSKEGSAVSCDSVTGWDSFDAPSAKRKRMWRFGFSDRETPRVTNYDVLDDSNFPQTFVLALASKPENQASPQRLANLIQDAISRGGFDSLTGLRFSVGPSAVLVALEDVDAGRTKQLLRSLRTLLYKSSTAPPVSLAISCGPIRPINNEGWITRNFEGRPAIVASRISAQLQKFQVGLCDNATAYFHGFFTQIVETSFKGKRDEVFVGTLAAGWLHQAPSPQSTESNGDGVAHSQNLDIAKTEQPSVIPPEENQKLHAPTDSVVDVLGKSLSQSSADSESIGTRNELERPGQVSRTGESRAGRLKPNDPQPQLPIYLQLDQENDSSFLFRKILWALFYAFCLLALLTFVLSLSKLIGL